MIRMGDRLKQNQLFALALYITATTVACQEQAINPPVEHTVNWLIQAAGLHT